MDYLVDTQILIWSLVGPEKLSVSTQTLLKNNRILVSQVSLYEIAVKQKIGKLPKLGLPTEALLKQAQADGFRLLPIKNAHIAAYNDVPLFPEHRDPFDRLILATALSETMPVVSADGNFRLYAAHIQLIEN